jgi:quercetin dioxygenase-like cupin family protein
MNIAATIAVPQSKVSWMGTQYSITVTKRDSAGLIGVFEGVVPAGDGPPIHVHHNEDEVIHVLEGEYEFWLNGEIMRHGSGTSVFLPRGVPHTFRVLGKTPGRNLAILTPGGFENFFVEVASRDLMMPRDMAEVVELGNLYGLEFVGPAPWQPR